MSADPSVKKFVSPVGPRILNRRSHGSVTSTQQYSQECLLFLLPHKSTCVEEPSVWSMLVRHLVSEVLVPTRCQSVGATMGDRAHGSWRCPHFAQAGPECVLFSSREMPQ